MQAIVTKYLGPTDRRGARIKATCDAGTMLVSYPDELSSGEPAHRYAAEQLAKKLGWFGRAPMIGGGLPDGRYAFVFDYDRATR